MSAATLILVDLDNLLGLWEDQGVATLPLAVGEPGSFAFFPAPDAPARPPEVPDAAPSTVAFACNLETLCSDYLPALPDEKWLADFARSAACSLGCYGPTRWQLALCPVAPQTADGMLLRLLVAAPSSDGCWFTRVALLSADRELRRRLSRALADRAVGAIGPPSKALQRGKSGLSGLTHGWGPLEPPLRRAAQTALVSSAPPEPLEPIFSARADTPGRCAEARARSLRAPRELPALARVARRQTPHVLTQVGPSTASLRGMERLQCWLGGEEPFSHITPREGVEFENGPLPKRVQGARESALGPGTVRFEESGVTVATQLPSEAVRRASEPAPLRLAGKARARLFDPSVLQQIPDGAAFGPPVSVRLWVHRGQQTRIHAEVAAEGARPPEAWWMRILNGRLSAKAGLSIEVGAWGYFLGPIRGPSQARLSRQGDELAFEAAQPASDRIRLPGPVAPGELRSVEGQDGSPLLLFAERRIPEGELEVEPIQRRTVAELSRFHPSMPWKELLLLPILVPRCPETAPRPSDVAEGGPDR